MQRAEIVLSTILSKAVFEDYVYTRVYRVLFDPSLYWYIHEMFLSYTASSKESNLCFIARTVKNLDQKSIDWMIEQIRHQRFKWLAASRDRDRSIPFNDLTEYQVNACATIFTLVIFVILHLILPLRSDVKIIKRDRTITKKIEGDVCLRSHIIMLFNALHEQSALLNAYGLDALYLNKLAYSIQDRDSNTTGIQAGKLLERCLINSESRVVVKSGTNEVLRDITGLPTITMDQYARRISDNRWILLTKTLFQVNATGCISARYFIRASAICLETWVMHQHFYLNMHKKNKPNVVLMVANCSILSDTWFWIMGVSRGTGYEKSEKCIEPIDLSMINLDFKVWKGKGSLKVHSTVIQDFTRARTVSGIPVHQGKIIHLQVDEIIKHFVHEWRRTFSGFDGLKDPRIEKCKQIHFMCMLKTLARKCAISKKKAYTEFLKPGTTARSLF
jgi:hypothetical protein